MVKKNLLAIILTLLFSSLLIRVVFAQQPTPSDDEVNAIAKQLYCPVCENTPLDVCPTTACAQWRELIRQKLADGWSEQAIKDYFVQQYGARVLGIPPAKGINWLVYLMPPIAILGGVYILYHAYRSWKHPAQAADISPSNPPVEMDATQDEYIRRVEDVVHKR
ncbi:MAG: cytochrome c-type biogenesis protein [Anaerolineales bacterium]